MITSYKLLLPNEKAASYRYIMLFIFLINLVVFLFIFFTSSLYIKDVSLAGAMVNLGALVLFFTGYAKKNSILFEIACIIIALIWLAVSKYILAILLLIFAVMGYYTNRKREILISREKIIFPSFPKKVFSWKEVSNVMLKDGILTIDLLNNTLIQITIDSQSLTIDEQEFNSFCRENIPVSGD